MEKNINVSMSDLSVDKINFDISNGSIFVQNIRSNDISQIKNDVDFTIQDSKILDTLTATSKQYDINVINTTAKHMVLSTEMGISSQEIQRRHGHLI